MPDEVDEADEADGAEEEEQLLMDGPRNRGRWDRPDAARMAADAADAVGERRGRADAPLRVLRQSGNYREVKKDLRT